MDLLEVAARRHDGCATALIRSPGSDKPLIPAEAACGVGRCVMGAENLGEFQFTAALRCVHAPSNEKLHRIRYAHPLQQLLQGGGFLL
jgi:hypothetical protein